jgi:hypothetical protein
MQKKDVFDYSGVISDETITTDGGDVIRQIIFGSGATFVEFIKLSDKTRKNLEIIKDLQCQDFIETREELAAIIEKALKDMSYAVVVF